MCLPLYIFEWGTKLKIVARTCTISVPSLILLPQSAQLSYFFFTPYGWTIRNKLTCLVRIARKNFDDNKLDKARSNLKQTWKILNEVINRRAAKSSYPASFTKNEMEMSNPTDIANNFCDYITNIEPNLESKILATNSSPKDFFSSSLSESISLQRLTVGELNNIVKSFNANKAPGHDNISMKIIHQSFQNIAQPLEPL